MRYVTLKTTQSSTPSNIAWPDSTCPCRIYGIDIRWSKQKACSEIWCCKANRIYNVKPWRHIVMETHCHGDTLPWRHIAVETHCHGDTLPRRHIAKETHCQGGHIAMETHCHGDTLPWRHIVMETHFHGDTLPRRHIAMETHCHGDTLPWRHIVMETHFHGDTLPRRHIAMETHCHGDTLSLSVQDTTKWNKLLLWQQWGKSGSTEENFEFEDKVVYEQNTSLSKLCVTRWTNREAAFMKVIANFVKLVKLWDICQQETRSRVIGCRCWMTLQYFLWYPSYPQSILAYWHPIHKVYSLIDTLSTEYTRLLTPYPKLCKVCQQSKVRKQHH